MENFIVHETDERMFFLRDMLENISASERLSTQNTLGHSAKCDTDIHIFAPNVMLFAKLVGDISEGSTVIGGRADCEAKAIFNSLDIKYFNILENEDYQASNAKMTADGALAALIDHSTLSLADLNVLVIGFGRIGAAMAKVLSALDVNFDIASTASARPARAFAKNVIAAENFNFAPYDAVINTVPAPIIAERDVLTFKQSAVYIDLASKPALNIEYARSLGIDADIYPIIPARTSPLSAARAMKNYIFGVLK